MSEAIRACRCWSRCSSAARSSFPGSATTARIRWPFEAAPLIFTRRREDRVHDQPDHLERLRGALAARYRIVREVGRGGMANVYLAHDLRHDRDVALKVLRPELATALGPERFLQEIQFAARLAHPHILPLHDSGEADGFLFYVMPYVEGESLRDRLDRQGPLPIDAAIRIVREVGDGLSHAHSLGVVHRDLKPENILFMGGHAVVADFGVATAVGVAGGHRLTGTGVSVGTPAYMSPEQVVGESRVDGRSDTYALGCVLYEMLAGDPPYAAPTLQAMMARKLSESPPSLSTTRDTIAPALDSVVRRALARLPADRFDSPLEFAIAAARAVTPDLTARPGAAEAGARPWRRRAVAGVLAAGVLVLALVVIVGLLRQMGGRSPAAGERTDTRAATIAVLPFENLGPPDQEYFATGMTDEITSRLDGVSGLAVVPRRAAQRYVTSGMTLRDIGRELGVEHLLVGSVRWAGGSEAPTGIRITLELLRARDERQIWSTSYDRLIHDIFEVQSDIAGQVVEKLGVTLALDEQSRLRAQPTTNHEAYTLYLKGRHFWNRRTEENIQTALDYFEQAVNLDPGYARAWVGIADSWIFRGWYSQVAPREAFPRATSAVRRALEFDSTLAEAHASLAHIHLEFDYDWEAAEREYRRAIALDPRYAIAHHWYGGFLSAMGRHADALREAEAARALDPLSLIVQTWVGLRHYFARRYDDAIAEYRTALDLDRDFAPAHWHLGWAYLAAGRLEEGVAAARQALALDPESLLYLASLGHAYARAGMAPEARATLARLAEASGERHVSAYHVAAIHAALEDTTATLDWLDRAYDERSPWIGYLGVDPRFDAVRSHPGFRRLLLRARLPPASAASAN
jgi:eukaryotic-like serine/threonine-protein kinase